MNNKYENLGSGDPVQTPSEKQLSGATDEAMTAEKIAGKTPAELADLYNNIQEKNRAADKKYQEAAKQSEQIESEREYFAQERQRQSETLRGTQDQLNQAITALTQRRDPSQPPSTPKFAEMSPDEAYANIFGRVDSVAHETADILKQYQDKIKSLEDRVVANERKSEYDKFFDKNIATKFKDVTQDDLDNWLVLHPEIQRPDDKVVLRAAAEVQQSKNQQLEARYQEYLKEKERLAKEAQGLGGTASGLGSIEPIKNFIDMDEGEQIKQMEEDARKINNVS